MRSALPLAALTIAIAVLLSGCVPHDPEITPPPEPSTEPIFASDEEALAAATDAYAAYLAMSDLIGHEGGHGAEKLGDVAVRDALTTSLDEFKRFVEQGYRSVGDTTISQMELQSYWDSPDGLGVVSAYACLDVSSVDVLDFTGTSVVNDSRADKQLLEVTFDSVASESLVVSLIEPWPNEAEC